MMRVRRDLRREAHVIEEACLINECVAQGTREGAPTLFLSSIID